MEMIFNELSLDPPFGDPYLAREKIANFVRTMAVARIRGVIGRSGAEQFLLVGFGARLFHRRLVVDETVERELKGRLRSEVTKAPYLEELFAAFEAANDALAEVQHDGAVGCRAGTRRQFQDLPLLKLCGRALAGS